HAPASSWRQVLDHFQPNFLLGCTATPLRLDGEELGPLFGGEPLYRYELGLAMQGGHLVPVRQHAVQVATSLDDVSTRSGDFTAAARAGAVVTPERTRAAVAGYLRHAAGRPALFFAVDLKHVEQLRQALGDAGVAAAGVTGRMPIATRRQVLRDFRE